MSAELNTKQLAILSYHKIGAPPAGSWNSWFYIPEETFLHQLSDLDAHGWQFLDHEQFVEGLENPEILPDRSSLITFDDGYRSMRTVVLPILSSFDIPAVLFVPTDYVGGSNTFDRGAEPEEAICSWSELQELELAGVSIHSHGVSHRRFSEMSLSEQKTEIASSKGTLENRLGKEVEIFAYPYGDDGANREELRRELAHAGYRAACLYHGGAVSFPAENPYRLPRLAMGPDTDLGTVLKSKGGNRFQFANLQRR